MIIRFYQSTISKVCKRSRKSASNANLELQAGGVAKRRSILFEFGINNANSGIKPFKCFKFSIHLLSTEIFANRKQCDHSMLSCYLRIVFYIFLSLEFLAWSEINKLEMSNQFMQSCDSI